MAYIDNENKIINSFLNKSNNNLYRIYENKLIFLPTFRKCICITVIYDSLLETTMQ